MLFNSINYLIFFPIVLAAYWLLPRSLRPAILLLASYVFYMSWLPIYGLLLFCLTFVNYFLALAISSYKKQGKALLVVGLVINLGTLAFYKYTNFLLKSVETFLQNCHSWLKIDVSQLSIPETNIILPLGISFFAFEFIHYITDVYKGGEPIRNPIHFGLFAAFFPSQIAGPIKRYQDFIQQLQDKCAGIAGRFDGKQFNAGLVLLLQGLFKKVALSDNLSPIVAQGFGNIASMGTLDAWIATIAFALQIYFDFSGYTDMGRGSAMMLGYSLPDNFNLPYIASSLSDFWKRWHISLSTWLRDYLYIPLGGGRTSRWRKHFNLLTTMLLGGLWHGPAWHFVAWGGFHGVGLIANHEYDAFVEKHPLLKKFHAHKVGKIVAQIMTFFLVLVGWILFRAQTTSEAFQIITRLFTFAESSQLLQAVSISVLPVGLVLYGLYAWAFSKDAIIKAPTWLAIRDNFFAHLPVKLAVYAGILFAAVGFSPSQVEPFIYFQF